MATRTSEQEHLQFLEDRRFLESRGIAPGPTGDYTTRQLAFELSRRGWRWQFDLERAEATKTYTPSGTVTQTVVANDSDTIANLAKVLVEAIRFDEAQGLTPPDLFRADIVVRASDDHLIALVEVKNRKGLTREIATAWRRNLLAHGFRSQTAPYFLMVSQETGHLWDQRQDGSLDAPPTASFLMKRVIERYVPWLESDEWLGEPQLQLVVAGWLSDLTEAGGINPGSPEEMLAGTGFLDAIRHAAVASDDRP